VFRRLLPLALPLVGFVVSRVLALRAGVLFDARPLRNFWQYLDIELLRDRLLESVHHLHTQPPLYNLFLGAILKLAGGRYEKWFWYTYLAAGVLLTVCLYLLLVRLGAGRWLAAAATTLFVVSPAAILYENFLIYDYLVAALLIAAALALHVHASGRGWLSGILFCTTLAALVLLRNAYHLVWMIAAGACLVFFDRRHWRRSLAVFAVPFALVLAWHVKSKVMFGFFGTSWAGQTLVQLTVWELPAAERLKLVADGTLSPFCAYRKPFIALPEIAQHLPPYQPRGIPALDTERKSTGAVNFNHAAYLDVSHAFLRDFKVALAHSPRTYLSSLKQTFLLFFESSTTSRFVRDNRAAIAGYNRLYNRWVYGEFTSVTTEKKTEGGWTHVAWSQKLATKPFFLMIGIPLAFVWAVVRLWRARKTKDLPFLATASFMLGTLLYATIVGNCTAIGDNHRYRFTIDGFFLAFLVLLAADLGAALRRRLARRRA
jgi:hypothetical protein